MVDIADILKPVPAGLREPLLECFREISRNYYEQRWEPSELNGGKFCEVVYTIVEGALSGTWAAAPTKPADMYAACINLQSKFSRDPTRVGDRSLRILLPRALLPLYEIRNNRGVGHVGGDVDPNLLDATAVYSLASWVLAELVRIFHSVTTQEAQATVDSLAERKSLVVWKVGDAKRVLSPGMPAKTQVLLLLHQSVDWVDEKQLFEWVEYTTPSTFRSNVLVPLHNGRLIEFDKRVGRAQISPLGIKKVEDEILKTFKW